MKKEGRHKGRGELVLSITAHTVSISYGIHRAEMLESRVTSRHVVH